MAAGEPTSVAAPDLPQSVVIAGGGSAGHVEPALAIADALRAAKPSMQITLLGTAQGLETRLVPARGYPLRVIPRVPLPRRLTPSLFTVPTRALGAVRAAGQVLDEVRADVVVGVGGYVAFPAYLAARRRGCGIVVHEANPLPGIAESGRGPPDASGRDQRSWYPASPRRADRDPAPHVAADAGPPGPAGRRRASASGWIPSERPCSSSAARKAPGGSTRPPCAAARQLTASGIQVLHAAGAAGAPDVQAALPGRLEAPYVVLPYIDDMAAAYAAADLALCRSGAMTCAELAAVGLPAIYVPLPIGNGEQRLNAEHAVTAGTAVMVADDQLTGAWVQEHVPALFAEPGRLGADERGRRSPLATGMLPPRWSRWSPPLIRKSPAARSP